MSLQKNDLGGTCKDIFALTAAIEKTSNELLPFFYKKEHGDVQITKSEFTHLVGAQYVDENRISREKMIHLWRQGRTFVSSSVDPAFQKLYDKFLAEAKTAFTIAPALSDRILAGKGLFSRNNYEPFEIVGEYIGEIGNTMGSYAVQIEKDISKEFASINASHYSNGMSLVNDGFPNLFLRIMTKMGGLPFRAFLVSLEKIKTGDQFCFSYGPHAVKDGPYVELRPEPLRKFIKKHTIEEWHSCMEKLSRFEAFTPNEITFVGQFRYILQTPFVLFTLIFDGSLKRKKAEAIFAIATNGQHIPVENCHAYQNLVPVAFLCVEAIAKMKKTNLKKAEMYRKEVIDLVEKRGIKEALPLLPEMCGTLLDSS